MKMSCDVITAVLFAEIDTGCKKMGGEKPLISIRKCGKTDYMQYDNAVLPVLRGEVGWHSWYSCWLQAERSGDRIPVGGKIFHANQTSPKAQPATYTTGNESFTGIKEAGAWC